MVGPLAIARELGAVEPEEASIPWRLPRLIGDRKVLPETAVPDKEASTWQKNRESAVGSLQCA